MMNKILPALLVACALLALAQVALLVVLPYSYRKSAADRRFSKTESSTSLTADVRLLLAAMLGGMALARGGETLDFLAGLIAGLLLFQSFFHRFSVPLDFEQAPPEPRSPVRWMLYAILATPARGWKEMTLLIILLCWSLRSILLGH